MKTNENKVTGRDTLFVALGTIIGVLVIEATKALALGMSFADSLVKILPEAFGRAACVALVFAVFYLIMKKYNK